jgi:hypothetical protein
MDAALTFLTVRCLLLNNFSFKNLCIGARRCGTVVILFSGNFVLCPALRGRSGVVCVFVDVSSRIRGKCRYPVNENLRTIRPDRLKTG